MNFALLALLITSSLFASDGVPRKLPEWTFNVGYHPVLDRPDSLATGFRRDERRSYKKDYVRPQTVPLPDHFDWRTEGLPAVKDQGKCGSCWAFATVGVVESLVRIRTGEKISLSEQQLISCNRDEWGCGGGDFGFRYYVAPKGAVTEQSFPYEGAGVPCPSSLNQS